jgi:iron(III) transport system substrate-binding protein
MLAQLLRVTLFGAGLLMLLALPCSFELNAGEAKPAWQVEWEKTLEAAKKEGKRVAAIPASAELRKRIEEVFKAQFPGIDVEFTPSRGPANASRILAEHRAGVRYFDLLISGTSTPFSMLQAGVIEPFEPFMIRPEVKEPKNWYGGHIWIDNAQRFIYSFQAYQTETIWHNSDSMKAEEIRSYDDLLNPKWKGKIGYLDPRTPGSGTATWAFLWKIRGEEYLRKLAAQDLLLSRDQRQLADSLAKGKHALTIGLTYYSLLAHVKAGLPVKPLPEPKEGNYTTCGSGALSIIKNPPHPNATKVFINWLLSKEGQDLYGKAMGQATRRLDVDTKWLPQVGVKAAKDFMTVEEHFRLENYGEDTVMQVWSKSVEFAEKVLK